MNEQGGDKHQVDAGTSGCELPVCILTETEKFATTAVASPQIINHHLTIEKKRKECSRRINSTVM